MGSRSYPIIDVEIVKKQILHIINIHLLLVITNDIDSLIIIIIIMACRRSAPRQQRHSHLNDIIWRAMKRAQIPAVKEPVGLMWQDGKRPDGTTILLWSRGRPLAWDVTVPDTYADAHVVNTAREVGAAANHAATNKNTKYSQLSNTRVRSGGH